MFIWTACTFIACYMSKCNSRGTTSITYRQMYMLRQEEKDSSRYETYKKIRK